MDPRHPEQAISRMRELMKQYDRIEADMKNCMVANKLAQLEREGGLVVQEICLVAPRIHEAMMQTSRQRRHQLAMGITYVPEERVGKYTKATIGIEEKPVMVKLERPLTEEEGKKIVESISADKVDEPVEKPKKKTTKKKTTKNVQNLKKKLMNYKNN